MKTLKQIREEYDNFNLVDYLPDELVLDEAKKSLIPAAVSQKDMPVMLLFRRITYKVYPKGQTVALYYSKMVDKYLSIPFGPKGNLNLSEAELFDSLNEDWQKVNRQDKTDGLSQAAVNAYRRENPGSKLKTAVTEKNPKGKRAARRKSFCSRMGGMKKRLTSAKTARDPDSRINKALRRWNCEEDFKIKLDELRIQQNEGTTWDTLKGAAQGAWAGRAAGPYGMAAGALMGGAAGYAKSKMSAKDSQEDDGKEKPGAIHAKSLIPGRKGRPGVLKSKSSFERGINKGDAAQQSIMKQAEVKRSRAENSPVPQHQNENKISDIKKLVESNESSMNIIINGRQVTLNNSMAKRILEVYDSVNTKNKKIVEGMLNEDMESFKKLLNFSIRK